SPRARCIGVNSVSKEPRSRFLVPLICIAIGGSGLRLVWPVQQSFWYDEVVSAKIAQARLLDILSGRSGDLGNPPFYCFLLGVWQRAVGLGDGVLRSLSAVLSLACIPLVYALGKRLFDDKVGLVAAGLLSISPFHIYMAQEARTFALMSFLALASSLVLVDAFANPKHLW